MICFFNRIFFSKLSLNGKGKIFWPIIKQKITVKVKKKNLSHHHYGGRGLIRALKVLLKNLQTNKRMVIELL